MRKRLAFKRQLSESLAEVEHSLHKLDDGTYGVCGNCVGPGAVSFGAIQHPCKAYSFRQWSGEG